MRLRWLRLKFFRKDVMVGATGTAGAAGVLKAANNATAFVWTFFISLHANSNQAHLNKSVYSYFQKDRHYNHVFSLTPRPQILKDTQVF